MPVVVATVFPRPERAEEVLEILRGAVPLVHAEEGCNRYALHQHTDRFVTIEEWADAESFAAHGRSENVANVRKQLDGLLAQRGEIVVLQPVPLGDPVKGVIS